MRRLIILPLTILILGFALVWAWPATADTREMSSECTRTPATLDTQLLCMDLYDMGKRYTYHTDGSSTETAEGRVLVLECNSLYAQGQADNEFAMALDDEQWSFHNCILAFMND